MLKATIMRRRNVLVPRNISDLGLTFDKMATRYAQEAGLSAPFSCEWDAETDSWWVAEGKDARLTSEQKTRLRTHELTREISGPWRPWSLELTEATPTAKEG